MPIIYAQEVSIIMDSGKHKMHHDDHTPLHLKDDHLHKRESDVLTDQLEQLKRNCKDEKTLSSINDTLSYIKQRHAHEDKSKTDENTGIAVRHNTNPIDMFKNRMALMERSIEDSILGDTRRHSLFRGMLDDMKHDMTLFDTGVGADFNRMFSEHMGGLGRQSRRLLQNYDIDDEEPEDAVGVSKQVVTETVNGKSRAKVNVEYTLKDGTKVQKTRNYEDGKPLEITQS